MGAVNKNDYSKETDVSVLLVLSFAHVGRVMREKRSGSSSSKLIFICSAVLLLPSSPDSRGTPIK